MTAVDITAITGAFPIFLEKPTNFYQLSISVLSSFENTVNFSQAIGLLPKNKLCIKCKGPLNLVKDSRGDVNRFPVAFRCANSKCSKKGTYIPLCKNSSFEGAHIAIGEIIALSYFFINETRNYGFLRRECSLGDDQLLGTETISDWMTYCREVC